MAIRSYRSRRPRIDPSAYVDEAAVVIGDVEIGAGSSVWPGCVLRGDVNHIRVGSRSNIQDGSILHVTHRSSYDPSGYPLTIGDEVTIGHQVLLHGCTLEDGCLIGMGSILLDGCVVRSGAMVAAGSLVAPGSDVGGGYLWVGRPAKRARPLSERERGLFRYLSEHYVKLKDDYLAEG